MNFKKKKIREKTLFLTVEEISVKPSSSRVHCWVIQPTLTWFGNYWALTVDQELFYIFFFFFKLYNIVLVLPYIEMNPPPVYIF